MTEDYFDDLGIEGFAKLCQFDLQRNKEPNTPSKETQRRIMQWLMVKKGRKDEVWCVISASWLNEWKNYVAFNSEYLSGEHEHPGPIDNRPVIKNWKFFKQWIDVTGGDLENNVLAKRKKYCPVSILELRDDAIIHEDYELIFSEAWELLLLWYGGKYNGYAPTIPRFSYTHGNLHPVRVDPFPTMIRCAAVTNMSPPTEKEYKFCILRLGRYLPFDDILDVILWFFDLKSDGISDCRLWIGRLFSPWKIVKDSYFDLFHSGFSRLIGHQLIAELTEMPSGVFFWDKYREPIRKPSWPNWGNNLPYDYFNEEVDDEETYVRKKGKNNDKTVRIFREDPISSINVSTRRYFQHPDNFEDPEYIGSLLMEFDPDYLTKYFTHFVAKKDELVRIGYLRSNDEQPEFIFLEKKKYNVVSIRFGGEEVVTCFRTFFC